MMVFEAGLYKAARSLLVVKACGMATDPSTGLARMEGSREDKSSATFKPSWALYVN